jgi:hypothetical protein
MNDMLQNLLSDEVRAAMADGYKPLAYGLSALGCFVLGTSPNLALRTPLRLRQIWMLLCPLYLLVAANCLVQGDVLWVQWARSFARAQHLYEERRLFQLAALLGLVLWASKAWQQYQQVRLRLPARTPVLHGMLLTGAAGTLTLLLLRYVSFHYTDLALNAVWLNHSAASWMEGACLGLAILASGLAIRGSDGHV